MAVPSSTAQAVRTTAAELAKRINIPLTPSSPAGLVEADTVDPWTQAGKYALGWTYFAVALTVLVALVRIYHLWNDKLRQAIWKQESEKALAEYYRHVDYTTIDMQTGQTSDPLFSGYFPQEARFTEKEKPSTKWQSTVASVGPINDTLALFRWIFYRPIPELKIGKRRLSFPSLAVVLILFIALAFVTCYCFVPQPLYWDSIRYGSPPLAIRAGMLSIAMTPWVVALAMKSNLITWITGIGHDRLGVFHRWMGYLTFFLALVHMVPFLIQPVWKDGGMTVFASAFPASRGIIYGTGIACMAPLIWLVVMSLPFIRSYAYELFVAMHYPVAIIYVGMLFWHCNNYLTSWGYLYATVAIWVLAYCTRLFNLNWTKPFKNAWIIGDEAAITLMAENAVKITIPTQMKWRPGQWVYLRMPGISLLENHPFTISSLCSEDFPSEYGEQYRDCVLVFRPYGGFTRKVLETAIQKGPFQTYRAYLDGPYGGMQRELAAFDTVVLFAGGSGITAIMSQLLNLIKRIRDGKAVTKKIEVVWALKRLEAIDWFKEELRICKEFAPPNTVFCQFYVTAAKRKEHIGVNQRAPRPISQIFHDKLDGFVAGIASKRNSALIRDEAQGDENRERELRAENEDAITSLPQQKYLQPRMIPPPLPLRDYENRQSALDDSLRKLEGKEEEQDEHGFTKQYLSVPSSEKKRPEFHFPPPSPRKNPPHFNYAPPSPRLKRQSYTYDPNNLPPPPPGPPPKDAPSFSRKPEAANPPRPVTFAETTPEPEPESESYQDFEDTKTGPTSASRGSKRWSNFSLPTIPGVAHTKPIKPSDLHISVPQPAESQFDFGFPATPTEFQKNLMRFAFMGSKVEKDGWTTEYGRPDLSYMLKEMSRTRGGFGRRTCVFVCGPPAMRVDVANAVASLQETIWGDPDRDEIFLHTENYAI